MSRQTVIVPRGVSAREAIERAKKAQAFEPAPSRRSAGKLNRYPIHDTDDELANKFTEVFEGDARGDRPGEGAVEIEPVEPEAVREARQAAGPGERVLVTRTGQVQIRDERGRIVSMFGSAARDESGRFVSRKIIVVGPAPDRPIYENALHRIIGISKSFFQSTGGPSPARLAAAWRGYQRNHPEVANARIEVEGGRVRIKRGDKTLADVDIDDVGASES